jgi:hypothetical protein
MNCQYRIIIPGDCHIGCSKKWTRETLPITSEMAKAIRALPKHAGIYPLCFNDAFICNSCPVSKDENKNKIVVEG